MHISCESTEMLITDMSEEEKAWLDQIKVPDGKSLTPMEQHLHNLAKPHNQHEAILFEIIAQLMAGENYQYIRTRKLCSEETCSCP